MIAEIQNNLEPEVLDERINILINWVQNNKQLDVDIDLDTLILEGNIIDSLKFVSLILLIEEIIDDEIPEETVIISNFKSIRTMYEIFIKNK